MSTQGKIFVDGENVSDQCLSKCVVKTNEETKLICGYVKDDKGVACAADEFYLSENMCLPKCVAGDAAADCAFNKDNAGVWTKCDRGNHFVNG